MIGALSSKIIHARMKTAFTGVRLNVMAQALHAKEVSLPKGLMIQNAYIEMCNGSKSVAIVVRNGMAYPQTLNKKIWVARVVATNCMPEVQVWPSTMDALDEVQGIQTLKMTTEQRQEKLFEKLDLSGLGSWPPELADYAHSLLTEYHGIYSLESCELSCTHSVHAHLWEMLDLGAVCLSQSMWCNAVVLVQKKDGSLCFCIDFCHLNAHTKKDSYPLPRIQEALESLVHAGHFLACTWNLGSGRSRWMSCWSNTPHLPLATWVSLSVTACPLGCAMCQPHSRG